VRLVDRHPEEAEPGRGLGPDLRVALADAAGEDQRVGFRLSPAALAAQSPLDILPSPLDIRRDCKLYLAEDPTEKEIQMTDVRSATQDLQGQILDTIRKSQEAVTDAIKTWAETVQSITPSLPAPSVPLADKLPKPSELVSNAYDFAEQLLATQRKFAEDVIAATSPVLTAGGDTAKRDTAAKKATQAK
jgi:hypothetical protein